MKRNIKYFLVILLLCNTSISFSQTWKELNDSLRYYFSNDNFPKAAIIGEKAVTQAEKEFGINAENYETSLDNLRVVYWEMSEYKKVIAPLERLATYYERKNNPIEQARQYNRVAIAYENINKIDKSEPYYIKAIELLQKDNEKELLATVLYNLADMYSNKKDFIRADTFFVQHFDIKKQQITTSDSDYVASLKKVTNLYYKEKIFSKAINYRLKLTQHFLEKYGSDSWQYAEQLNNAAMIYEQADQKESAEETYKQSIQILRKKEDSKELLATVLANLGLLYQDLGHYKEAKTIFIESNEIRKAILGENSPVYANGLSELALAYKNMGQYSSAESLYLQAKAVLLKAHGENHKDFAKCINNLAVLYVSMGQYKKALPFFLQSKEIRKKLDGVNSVEYATVLNNLAGLYATLGQYPQADSSYTLSNKILKTLFGQKNYSYGVSLGNMALFYKETGQFKKAESFSLQSNEVLEKTIGINHPDYSINLNNLALLYKTIGQYEKADSCYKKALEIIRNTLGEEHPTFSLTLSNLSTLYELMGDFDKAEQLNIQATEIVKNTVGDNHPDYFTNITGFASLYQNRGLYAEAEPLYLKATEGRKSLFGEEHLDYAASLNSLGVLYIGMGQYEKAEKILLQSKEIRKNVLGEMHPDYATILNALSSLYVNMDDYNKAEPLLLQSTEIIKNAFGENNLEYSTRLNNLATLYNYKKQFAKAEPLYLESTSILKKLMGENHPDYARNLNNQAALYEQMGQLEKAETFYKQSAELMENNFNSTNPVYTSCLNNLAAFYESTGQYTKAEQLILKSNAIEFQNIRNTFTILSEKEKGSFITNKIFLNNHNNSIPYNYPKASGQMLINNFNLQLLLKSLSLSSTKNMMDAIRNNGDSAIQRIFINWKINKAILAKQFSLPATERRADLIQIEEKAESLEKELARKSSAFKKEQQSIQIKTTNVQKNLLPGEAAIEFVKFGLYNNKKTDSIIYAAYILTNKDSVPVFIPLCEEKQLQKLFDSAGTTATSMVSKFYRGLEIKNKNTVGALGTELYKLIWQPLELYLKGVKKISYSPAGKLYSLAFHALPVDSVTVLMDRYQLQQYTSTRQVVLREQEKQNSKPQNITLFGDAAFTLDSIQIAKSRHKTQNLSTNIYTPPTRGTRGNTWSSLPGTAEEVKKIKTLFETNNIATQSFTQTIASEENLKALGDHSPQILHIATHGFFLPEPDKKRKENSFNNENTYTLADDPLLRSGLILSGGNYAWSSKTPIDGVEDGIATAYEISQLNLSNTELVVLSACETALGDIKGSEGVFGLQRAFKMAGVKKMIVSLWQVPDKETAELMTSFYGYWLEGKTITEAFTQAQAEMRKKYSPFYWAAFVLVE